MNALISVGMPVLYVIVVIIAILLIGLVLLQPSKGGGLGSAFGGFGEGVFGAQTLSHLSKLTIVMMSVFFALTLLLAILSGHKQKARSIVETDASISAAAAAAPAASAQKAPQQGAGTSAKPAPKTEAPAAPAN